MTFMQRSYDLSLITNLRYYNIVNYDKIFMKRATGFLDLIDFE